jgi:hypothetical protein
MQQVADDITIVSVDDWVGLYINGRLVYEDHSLDEYHLFQALKIKYKEIDANEKWIWHEGELPLQLKDVVSREQEYDCDCGPNASHS